jgi:hypothetical protein
MSREGGSGSNRGLRAPGTPGKGTRPSALPMLCGRTPEHVAFRRSPARWPTPKRRVRDPLRRQSRPATRLDPERPTAVAGRIETLPPASRRTRREASTDLDHRERTASAKHGEGQSTCHLRANHDYDTPPGLHPVTPRYTPVTPRLHRLISSETTEKKRVTKRSYTFRWKQCIGKNVNVIGAVS